MPQGFTIYHNPRCSKSRQTLAILEDHDIQPQVVLYLQHTPNTAELAKLVKQLGLKPRDLLRKGEAEYKELGLGDTAISDAAILEAMSTHPKLIERPIVVQGNRAVLGRPPENVLELL